jgi:hypothetical protein
LLAGLQGIATAVGASVHSEGSHGRDASRDSDVAGSWFAGCQLRARTCGGDCSHEGLVLARVLQVAPWQRPEARRYFECCKTAYKPYYLAAQCALLIAKEHLGEAIVVSSDGSAEHWDEARALCENVLGYGEDFRLAD